MSAGNETLARTALERKNVAQTELQGLDTQVTELESQQEKLTDSEQKLRAKIESFRTKKEVIKAQYSAAEAQVRISEAATGVGEQMADVGLAMQRAVDKTENMKARADAVSELEAAGTFDDVTALGAGEDDIDRQLKELSSQPAVDDELAKMKGELGAGRRAPAAQIPPQAMRPRRGGAGGAGTGEAGGQSAARHDRPDLRRGPVPRSMDADAARLNELEEAVVARRRSGGRPDGFDQEPSPGCSTNPHTGQELMTTRSRLRCAAAGGPHLRGGRQGEFTGRGPDPRLGLSYGRFTGEDPIGRS